MTKEQKTVPKMLYREWTFQSHNPGLKQVLLPSRKDQAGNLIDEAFEADFGGDTGREGMWRMKDTFRVERNDGVHSGTDLVTVMRTKMAMKPVADMNIVELTQDRKNGDPVYEPVESEEDAVPQPSR